MIFLSFKAALFLFLPPFSSFSSFLFFSFFLWIQLVIKWKERGVIRSEMLILLVVLIGSYFEMEYDRHWHRILIYKLTLFGAIKPDLQNVSSLAVKHGCSGSVAQKY